MTHTFENNTFSSYIDCFCGECKISSSQLNYNCYKAIKIPSSLKVRARKRGKGQKNKTGRKQKSTKFSQLKCIFWKSEG